MPARRSATASAVGAWLGTTVIVTESLSVTPSVSVTVSTTVWVPAANVCVGSAIVEVPPSPKSQA